MTDDRSGGESSSSPWYRRILHSLTSGPDSTEELQELIDEARDNRIVDADVHGIIQGALQVSDTQVQEVMVPRSQMVMLEINSDPRKLLEKIIQSGHSRFPVIGESIDEIMGVLLAKDLLPLALDQNVDDCELRELVRPITFVPESKRLNVLLHEFRQKRSHMAIVIDEYGDISGLVTIEDVLEEIVGEIEDEFDEEEANLINAISDRAYNVNALTPLEKFNEFFATGLDESEFDTIGGLVSHEIGHLPKKNEEISINDLNIRVIGADKRRVIQLRVTCPKPLAEHDA